MKRGAWGAWSMTLRRNCDGMTRRDCLQVGLGALLGGGLAHALGLRAKASGDSKPEAKAKSCILIWMDGGPTHYETFDPKPAAPKEIRGEFGTTPTKVPGAHFSELMTRLASIADRIAVVRSIQHNEG